MKRPLPRPTADTRPFWAGCSIGELRYQVCGSCGQVQPIPRSLCSRCRQRHLQWRVSGGRGRILSHTTVHRAPLPSFRDDVPYVIALVEMDEGFRLMVNLAGGDSPALRIGRGVRIGFLVVDGVSLPHAELAE